MNKNKKNPKETIVYASRLGALGLFRLWGLASSGPGFKGPGCLVELRRACLCGLCGLGGRKTC